MAGKPDGKPANQRVTFTKAAADRIASAVREVEAGNRDCGPMTFTPSNPSKHKAVFRVCTFTGSWAIDSMKTVTFRSVTTTPNTVTAINIFAEINGGTSSACVSTCAIAKEGTAWYLVAAGCQCR